MAINRTKLIEYALVAVPTPPARFTLSEWYLGNRFRNRICLDQQKLADSVIAESDRLIDEVNEKTDINKRDVDHKLSEKIKDIEFNRDEINKQRKEVCMEIDNLNTYMDRLHDALKSLTETAMEVCRKCIILREGRLGIDLCCDTIEKELKKEYEILEGAQNLLRRTLEQANEQVRKSEVIFLQTSPKIWQLKLSCTMITKKYNQRKYYRMNYLVNASFVNVL